ncbi:MAG: glycosyltransferase family 39 protein [Lachnospiraceae bacterium]|nr:glycosyltransferase family 39 protein [Lachnospiraceae bacterium]
MTNLHLTAVYGILLFGACFYGIRKDKYTHNRLHKSIPILVFALALLARLISGAISEGFPTDTSCFSAWADSMFRLGPSQFYEQSGFSDYPPGYMYVLWLIGAIKKLFNIQGMTGTHLLLLKLPSIICDMVLGFLLYKEANKKFSDVTSLWLTAAYLFNPAVFLNSSVWGQVDAILALAVVGMCLCLSREKMYLAYIIFGLGVLFKPQMLLFGPVLLAGIIDHAFLKGFTTKKFFTNLWQGLSAIAGMVLLMLPFGFMNVWNQYFSTVESYPYAAVNTCNFWGMFGLNWVSQDLTFLGIPYKTYGTIFIVLSVALVLYLSLRLRNSENKYFFLSALLIVSIFVFSVRMHERYMFPALALLLFAYIYHPIQNTLIAYAGFSIIHFYNTAWVLFFYGKVDYIRKAPIWVYPSIGILLCTFLLYKITYQHYSKDECLRNLPKTKVNLTKKGNEKKPTSTKKGDTMSQSQTTTKWNQPTPSESKMTLSKIDYIWMIAITLIYSVFALINLGDMHAPKTTFDMTKEQVIELSFEEQSPTQLHYYIAPWHDRKFNAEYATADGIWQSFGEVRLGSVFTWQHTTMPSDMKQLKLVLNEADASILEFVFTDDGGNIITPTNHADYPALFDEADEFPKESSFRNSMYFDEIYHGRTAYEFVHDKYSYENTHPPFGKVLISIGVAIFGMNPFGWRIMGTLFGIFMLPFIYLFTKRITKNIPISALACSLFAFDFMHFTQTRIATIDVYVTFFVILMYYFMYQYTTMSFYDTPLKKTFIPLAASGVCMGFGIASKWTGAYAGAGLAVIFFVTLYKRYAEYQYARRFPRMSTNGISHRTILDNFKPNTIKTIKFCLIAFVVVPFVIYTLSYIPFDDYSTRPLISRMLRNQKTMFEYHSALDATHPYSSSWYQWPTIVRPVWYYSRIVTGSYLAGGMREGISAFGNPAVWWLGIPAAVFMVILLIRSVVKEKSIDKTAFFLLVGYMAQYLPWFFVTRITFIYHYFPSVVFVVLMIAYSLMQLKKILPKKVFITTLIVYGLIAFGLFVLFYPVLSGTPVEAEFVDKYLRWFDGWVLTSQ